MMMSWWSLWQALTLASRVQDFGPSLIFHLISELSSPASSESDFRWGLDS